MLHYQLFVLFAAFYGVNGASYDEYDLISSGICIERRNAFFTKLDSLLDSSKHIRFVSDFRQGVIMEQVWNSSSFKRYNECKFTLQGLQGTAVFLTVRNMTLRRDARGNCIDTVTIKQSNGKKSRFCYSPTDVPRSFFDQTYMKITIRLDHLTPLLRLEDTLHLQMVATQARKCISTREELRCEAESCIHKSFANDGKINCPSCVDEGSCSLLPEEIAVANKPSYGQIAFISIVSCTIAFALGLLIIYKALPICRRSNSTTGGAVDTANQTDRGRVRGRGRTRTDVVAGVHSVDLRGSSNDVRPSAPALEEKDLPPSYDVLFPPAAVASGASTGPTTVSTATSPTIPKANLDEDAAK